MTLREHSFSLGGATVDPTRNMIRGVNGDETLEPRIMDVLCCLAEHAGRVLPRDDIIDAVWGRRFGADESLTRAVSRLRKAFTQVGCHGDIIETIPKRGYRLVAAVGPIADEGFEQADPATARKRLSTHRWLIAASVISVILVGGALTLLFARRDSAVDAAPEPITVLLYAFDSEGSEPPLGVRGIGDLVAASLSRASLIGLRRVDRSASMPRSNYVFIVRGTLRTIGPHRIRVQVELSDAATGASLWTGLFDRDPTVGPLDTDELADAIGGELTNRVLLAAKTEIRGRPINTLQPWELTLLATWTPGGDEVFLEPHGPDAFWPQERALEINPGYAPAHASLASAMAYRALFTANEDGEALRRAASEHADRARALAPYDAGVLYELATYYRILGDRKQAVDALDRVLAIQPAHPVARLDRLFVSALCTGEETAAVHKLEQALSDLSPDNPVRWVVLSHVADLQLAQGDAAAAAASASQSRQIVRSTWSGITLAAALAVRGRAAEAFRVSAETRREWPALDWAWFARSEAPAWCLGGAGTRQIEQAFLDLAAVAPMDAN